MALAFAAAPANAEFVLKGSFGPDGVGGTQQFVEASSVAVDAATERLYVLDGNANTLYKFNLKGEPVDFGGSGPNLSGNALSGLVTAEGNPGERQVAVNPVSHVIYVTGQESGAGAKALEAFKANGEPSIFSATGTNEITGFQLLRGVSADQNGDIYTSDGEGGKKVEVYDSSGAVIVSGVKEQRASPAGSAVDSRGNLFVLFSFDKPARLVPSEYPVTLATTYTESPDFADPSSAHGLAVDPETDTLYVSEYAPTPRIAVFGSESAPEGHFAGPGESGELEGPQGLAAVSFEEQARVYVADSPAGGPSKVKIFVDEICKCAPEVEATSVSEVSGDSATLHAKIDPFGQATTYWFEYGLEDCAVGPCEKVPAEGGSIAAAKKAVAVQYALAGLQPQTTYHFRVVAENETDLGEPSADETFTTQASGLGAALSDSRAWEMVSPPKKLGGVVITRNATAIQAARAGGKLAYASLGSLLEDPTSNRVPEPASLVAERGAGGEWTNRELTPPHSETSLFVHGQTEFKLFTPDLLRSVMEPSDNLPLSSEASERTPYLWEDGEPPAFTPLLTSANVPPGTELNPEPSEANRVQIAGASPDLSVIAVKSMPPLAAGAAEEAVYAWSGGTLEAVSELPAAEGGAVVKGSVGTGRGSVRGAVSEDGSRIFWSSFAATDQAAGLYLHDRSTGKSWRLDLKKAGGSGLGTKRPAFAGASADGGVVFFTDSQRLTPGASVAGRDLYRCQIGPVGGGGLGCAALSDISAPRAGSGESSEVIDQIPAISEDGTRLFFVARGILDEEANEAEESAKAGEPNLYFWREGEGVRFVATLSEEDSLIWGIVEPGEFPQAVNISAALSPNGRYLAFSSEMSLTGYENQNADGHPTSEVFLYDSEAEGDRLSCISCNPTGASAIGEKLPEKLKNFPPDPGALWAGRWTAATLPEATKTEFSGPSLYRPRSVLDNGRVFFNSVDPLVAADSNGEWDVYQYQPLGVGSCAAGSGGGAVARSGAGCVGLLSSGSAQGDAGFLDASQSGEDAFFLTPTRLSVLDRDEELDVYDARVNGIPAVLKPVQECAGEACQPSAGPPNDPTPASESFKGAQTPLHCRKGQKKVRRQGKVLCVHKRHHHKHHKHKKQAKKSGGAGR